MTEEQKSRYLSWRDVRIERHVEFVQSWDEGEYISGTEVVTWSADFSGYGKLAMNSGHSDIPTIAFSTTGDTAEEAGENLKKIAAEQGWKFK